MKFPTMQTRISIFLWMLNLFALTMCLSFINPGLANIYMQISVTLIIMWFAFLISYYVWAIYYYNINLGYSDEEWERLNEHRSAARTRRDAGETVTDEELSLPENNPYKDKTFGLPEGTVRGTIALTILVMATAMLILQFESLQTMTDPAKASDYEKLVRINNERLQLFGEAFLMMVAFYFGTKGLELLQRPPKSTSS